LAPPTPHVLVSIPAVWSVSLKAATALLSNFAVGTKRPEVCNMAMVLVRVLLLMSDFAELRPSVVEPAELCCDPNPVRSTYTKCVLCIPSDPVLFIGRWCLRSVDNSPAWSWKTPF